MKKNRNSASIAKTQSLLQSEIVRVAGCTESASVAFAFLWARRHLQGRFDPRTGKAILYASGEVIRNASTAVVPFLNRRGLRTVVAAGLCSNAKSFNLFPSVNRVETRRLLRSRSWLAVHPVRQKGVYVKAVLSVPGETVSVLIHGRHDQIRSIERNGKLIFQSKSRNIRIPDMKEIAALVANRDRGLESIARDFITRQVRGGLSLPIGKRVSSLVRARMCGMASPVMTITGSGNHGILLGVPFYDLYRKRGKKVLPAALFSLLAEIHMTARQSRISEDCGLGTKAGPALAAGLAYANRKELPEIMRLMRSVSRTLRKLECHGARASCGRKAEKVVEVVMAHLK